MAVDGMIACGRRSIAHDELFTRAARVSAGLEALGVGAGDRVAVLMRNSVEYLEIALGVRHLGAYPAPLNWHLRAGELAAILEDLAPSTVFVHADLQEGLSTADLTGVRVIVVGTGDGAGEDGYAAWRDAHAPIVSPAVPSPGSIMYTSGTTGRPKGVARLAPTPVQARAMADLRVRMYALGPQSRALVPGPLYHAMPNHFALQAVTEAAYLNVMPRFDAEEMLAEIERQRITTVVVAPIMFIRLLRLPEAARARYDLSSLEWVLHAGGPCPEDVKRQMIAWWGPVVGEYYGGTETGPLTLCASAEWLDHPGSVGRPMPEATLRIVDADGADCPTGAPGVIYGRLSCYPEFTYRNSPEKRAEVGLGDLVTLGDVGYLDDDGYLYLCGRSRDMIISGGVNIYPAEIEAALLAQEGVDDCCVIGAPDPEFGETVVAFACGDGIDPERLRAALRAEIAGFKVPRTIIPVETLGRDPSGKLNKGVWRERYAVLAAENQVPKR